jgi:hypothetical protein
MDPTTHARDTDLICRVTVTLEGPDGRAVVETTHQEWLPEAAAADQVVRLPVRVERLFKQRIMPDLLRELRRRVEREVPAHPGSFDEEWVRRVDQTDEVMACLDRLDPRTWSDADDHWVEQVANLVVAEQHNRDTNWE